MPNINVEIFIALVVVTVVNSYSAMDSSYDCGNYYHFQIEFISERKPPVVYSFLHQFH